MINTSVLRHAIRAAVILAVFGAPASAEVFKCTDAKGKIQYTDTPCGQTATAIKKHSAPTPPAGPDERMRKTQRLLDAMEAERNQEKKAAADQKTEKERRERNCYNARDRYRQIIRASRLYDLDKQGNRVILTDDERARSTENARAEVDRWCK